ncbi:hypothetical protein EZV73_13405 [Acidaminobacter sp. JC074]|uniref:hypothetical protein n=1 Tax=Acidaminobacter sp. JC074 TaxID=2530199 RepID=UPI001F0EE6A8|nr:hypothetical protein [Acidaminobacter sp. JC074]MCH4888583.1 hypothetical protein [Acidaminobacter sp. JC074]
MFDLKDKKKLFLYGKENYKESRIAASGCQNFSEDDEDEQVDTVLMSCYNCRYRRWTSVSFQCMR